MTSSSTIWKLALAVTAALFSSAATGYFLGYFAHTHSTWTSLRVKLHSTDAFHRSDGLTSDGGLTTKQIRHLRNPDEGDISMHTVFMSGCDKWQDWEAVGLYWSFMRAGQPGEITRLMGCNSEELLHRNVFWVMPTWVTYGVNQLGNDLYPIYNKPWVLSQWFKEAKPRANYFLVLDSDMTIHRAFLPNDFRVEPGWAAAGNIWYLQDLNSVLVEELFPQLRQRFDDWEAAPGPGRRADEVAEFYFLHRDDARRVADLYWEYTPPIRDFMANMSVEAVQRRNATTGGEWVSETHAYPVAAAVAGVRHHGYNNSIFHVAHPIYDAAPNALHYCWQIELPGYTWFKHNNREFDISMCPPWIFSDKITTKPRGGLFPHPPSPLLLESKGGKLVSDLLSIEIVALLNQGFCHLHHYRFCPHSQQLIEECTKADRIVAELEERWEQVKLDRKGDLYCLDALEEGCDCESADAEYCRATCGLCTPQNYSHGLA